MSSYCRKTQVPVGGSFGVWWCKWMASTCFERSNRVGCACSWRRVGGQSGRMTEGEVGTCRNITLAPRPSIRRKGAYQDRQDDGDGDGDGDGNGNGNGRRREQIHNGTLPTLSTSYAVATFCLKVRSKPCNSTPFRATRHSN